MLRIHPRPAEEVRVPRVGEEAFELQAREVCLSAKQMDGFAETGSSYTGAGWLSMGISI